MVSKQNKAEEKDAVETTGTYSQLLNEARTNKRAKSLMPTFIEFEKPGSQVVGKFMARNEVGSTETKKGYYQYTFETDHGLVKFHLGNVTDADAGSLMEVGRVYFIEFQGQEKLAGGKRVNKFIVERLYTEEEARVGGLDDQAF
jgi:hypothetical protein